MKLDTSPMSGDETQVIHLVPVFQKDLPAVWKLLAELNAQSAITGASPGSSIPTADLSWSEADLVALFALCKPIHRAILTRIAESGMKLKPATYEELRGAGARAAKNADFNYDNMRANLAWISKYGRKVKGLPAWPVSFSDRGAAQPTGQRYEYLMSKNIAETWLKIAAAE